MTHVDDFYFGGTRQFCEKVVLPLKNVFHLSSEHFHHSSMLGLKIHKKKRK